MYKSVISHDLGVVLNQRKNKLFGGAVSSKNACLEWPGRPAPMRPFGGTALTWKAALDTIGGLALTWKAALNTIGVVLLGCWEGCALGLLGGWHTQEKQHRTRSGGWRSRGKQHRTRSRLRPHTLHLAFAIARNLHSRALAVFDHRLHQRKREIPHWLSQRDAWQSEHAF